MIDKTSELAKPEDVPYIVEIEKNTWPSGEDMVADKEKFKIRQKLGGLVVTRDSSGQILGYVSVFKPKWASAKALGEILYSCDDSIVGMPPQQKWNTICQLYGIPHEWHEATGDGWLYDGASSLHDPKGKVVFGVGVTTDKKYQGHGVVNRTLSKALQLAAEDGAEYFMGFSRLPAFQSTEEKFKDGISLDEYINLYYKYLSHQGLYEPYDYGFRFHWNLGAQPARTKTGKIGYIGIPTAMKDDAESKNAGVLVVTPLKYQGNYYVMGIIAPGISSGMEVGFETPTETLNGEYLPATEYKCPFDVIVDAIGSHTHIAKFTPGVSQHYSELCKLVQELYSAKTAKSYLNAID